jgi:hypothetical protein
VKLQVVEQVVQSTCFGVQQLEGQRKEERLLVISANTFAVAIRIILSNITALRRWWRWRRPLIAFSSFKVYGDATERS